MRQIEIFNAVYSSGSISSAARALAVAQPTVSKILKHTEDQLGFLLFQRSKGRLVATSEANVLYKETKSIYRQIAKLNNTVDNLKNPDAGKFRIVSVAALGLEALPKVIQKYRAKYKETRFIYQTHHYHNLVKSLLDYDKDLGFALNPPPREGIKQIPTGEGELVCIYQNGEFDNFPERLKFNDLEGHDFVSIEASGPLGDILSERMTREDSNFNSKIIAQTYFVARNLVGLGSGIAIVDSITAKSAGPGSPKYKGFNPPMKFAVKALYAEERPLSNLYQDFLEFLKENIEL
ncbi:MAG: LysR family transcriptional regulator [Emcibacteraceae bacterium]|nr:LysR family transcriptional regulator [Emcibacteraceae bacterium]